MFDPLDFLPVAYALKNEADEAKIRTSIGRAYYAAFLYAREWLRAKNYDIFDDYRDHGKVPNGLEEYIGRKAKDKMIHLHDDYRKVADYA
jgi:uncharacterized protein (UPF0332 family)